MTAPDIDTSVGEWVARHPHAARVFESFRIDYCCGGAAPLGEACKAGGHDARQVLAELARAAPVASGRPATDWRQAPLAELCDHIERTHHAYLRRELSRLSGLLAKVTQAHGAAHAELAEVGHAFAGLRSELEPHMLKEEMALFPAVRLLEGAEGPPRFPFGAIANPIRVMRHEHDAAGEALARLRALTGEYRTPGDACPTYRVLLEGLRELERDLHQHVHLENNILFPRAEALESRCEPASAP